MWGSRWRWSTARRTASTGLVTIHPHVVRLRPAPHSRTKIESYSLTVEPADHFINWQQDPFGNFMARLVFPERATELSITVGLVADLTVVNPFDFFIEEYAEHYGFVYPADLAGDLEPYLRPVDEGDPGSGPGPLVTQLAGRASPIWPNTAHRRFPGAAQRRDAAATSATRCGWNRACRPRTTR